MGSVVLPHLVTGWHVDQAILSEEERLVVIRFGRDWDPDCMRQDEVLYRTFQASFPSFPAPNGFTGIADRVKNFAVIYVCDLDQVPDFKQMCVSLLSPPHFLILTDPIGMSSTTRSPSCSSSAIST